MKFVEIKKKAMAVVLLFAATAAFGCAKVKYADADLNTKEPVLTAAPSPTAVLTDEPTEMPTEEPTPEPTPAPTPEPTPTPTPPPPGYLTEEEKLMLVNFEHRLADDYVPHDLVSAVVYLKDVCKHKYSGTRIQIEVADQLIKMLEAAKAEGVGTKYLLVSAYRTQQMQRNLWNRRIGSNSHYGEDPYNDPVGTMPYNASEHCAGLAIDITSEKNPGVYTTYGSTPEGRWMRDNAHRFGFILRYSKEKENITGVHYEPWHFRYVGVEAATEIFESGVCLEEYLGQLPPHLSGNGGEVYSGTGVPNGIFAACIPERKQDGAC